jgi:uncharacterized membrane protein
MAGSQKGNRGTKKGSGPKRVGATEGAAERRPSEYAREALSEWRQAIRYAASAVRPGDRPPLKQRLKAKEQVRGRVGNAADALLSKLGAPGKMASKLGLGSRMLKGIGGGHAGSNGRAASEGDGSWGHDMPIPIQESMEVAVPVRTAYALCTRFADYSEFIDRIESVEEIDDATVAFEAKVRGVHHRIEVQIVDERPNRRIDWEGGGDFEHSGVISFHELAPSLTHIELSVDLEPQDVVQRLTRAAHLTERAIRADMHRFKAYAELWQEEESEEEDGPVDGGEAATEQESADEEELEDGEEFVDEEQPEDYAEAEEYDEESEPVQAG